MARPVSLFHECLPAPSLVLRQDVGRDSIGNVIIHTFPLTPAHQTPTVYETLCTRDGRLLATYVSSTLHEATTTHRRVVNALQSHLELEADAWGLASCILSA